jgi:hypothetical protein
MSVSAESMGSGLAKNYNNKLSVFREQSNALSLP